MYKILQFIISITLSCQMVVSAAHAKPTANKDDQSKQERQSDDYYIKQFYDVFKRIDKDYIKNPDHQEMVDEAINGMLQSLDPYSGYFTDEDLEFFLTQTDGEFGGIGVEIIPSRGAVKVITPIDDLPADKAGIKAGDLIIGVNGRLVSNMGFNKAVKQMRGEPGSKLNLLVAKEEDGSTKEIELIRQIVKIKPIKHEIEISDVGGIGYIRIVAFNAHTTSELKKAVKTIKTKLAKKKQKLKGLIIDVRNNPGGLLDQAVALGEYFIDHGTIVSIKTKDKRNDSVFSAGRFAEKGPKVPIVVLINSGSASAAEILAGALQDHRRAIIIGTTSFGKGLVQTFTRVNPRAGVKITTAKYYTPNGRSINAKGIIPDIYIDNATVKFPENEEQDKSFTSSSVKEYLKKYNNDETESENKSTNADKKSNLAPEMSEKYKNDYQYARAYDLIRGLIVSNSK